MMRRALMTLVLALAGSAGVAGCGHTGAPPSDNGGAARPDRTYVVTGVTVDGQPHRLVTGTEIRLSFHDRTFTLTAGCNAMSGAYALDGTRLSVTRLATTERGCARPLMDQDTWVAGLFAHPVQFTGGGNGAVISGRTVLAVTARTSISPDVRLTGTTWLLETVYDGQTASSVPAGDVAWVVFDEHGGVRVHDGLNDGSGSARVSGTRIVFGDLTWTAVGCSGGPSCPVGDFARVFSGTTSFTITEQHLTLTQGGEGLGFRAVDHLPAHR